MTVISKVKLGVSAGSAEGVQGVQGCAEDAGLCRECGCKWCRRVSRGWGLSVEEQSFLKDAASKSKVWV